MSDRTHDLETTVGRCAALLDSHAAYWWRPGALHPADVARELLRRSRPLNELEELVCAVVPLDLPTAQVVMRAWQREKERRRTHGTPMVVLSDVERAAHEEGPAAHVRVQTDGDGTDPAVWFRCDHCGQTRHVRADTRRDVRREGHDFLLKHKRCPAPKPVLQ